MSIFGGIFDTGGDDDQQEQMKTTEEQGGFFYWIGGGDGRPRATTNLPGASFGGQTSLPPVAATGMGTRLAQNFVHSKIEAFLDGPEFGDVDLIDYDAPDGGGWVPNVSLTPTGKKWGIVLLAAVGLFWITKGRR